MIGVVMVASLGSRSAALFTEAMEQQVPLWWLLVSWFVAGIVCGAYSGYQSRRIWRAVAQSQVRRAIQQARSQAEAKI